MTPILGLLGSILPNILDRVLPGDSNKAQELQAEITKEILKHDQLQLEVNKAEAQHTSVFVSGWRPAAGWLGVIGLAYGTLGKGLIDSILVGLGFEPLPNIDHETLSLLLYGMLGIGGLRTYEKAKYIARK